MDRWNIEDMNCKVSLPNVSQKDLSVGDFVYRTQVKAMFNANRHTMSKHTANSDTNTGYLSKVRIREWFAKYSLEVLTFVWLSLMISSYYSWHSTWFAIRLEHIHQFLFGLVVGEQHIALSDVSSKCHQLAEFFDYRHLGVDTRNVLAREITTYGTYWSFREHGLSAGDFDSWASDSRGYALQGHWHLGDVGTLQYIHHGTVEERGSLRNIQAHFNLDTLDAAKKFRAEYISPIERRLSGLSDATLRNQYMHLDRFDRLVFSDAVPNNFNSMSAFFGYNGKDVPSDVKPVITKSCLYWAAHDNWFWIPDWGGCLRECERFATTDRMRDLSHSCDVSKVSVNLNMPQSSWQTRGNLKTIMKYYKLTSMEDAKQFRQYCLLPVEQSIDGNRCTVEDWNRRYAELDMIQSRKDSTLRRYFPFIVLGFFTTIFFVGIMLSPIPPTQLQ